MINIRPHHLLCIHGFQGKGYSDGFIKSMTHIVNEIKNNKDIKLNITYNTDDICSNCPNKIEDNLCIGQEKIVSIDQGVIEALRLEERVYSYAEVVEKINNELTIAKFQEICSTCEWYSLGSCKEGLFSSLYSL